MKWFWRYICKKVRMAESEGSQLISKSAMADVEDHDRRALNINVCSAIGGTIVTFRHRDVKGEWKSKTYLIHEDAQFEAELGKMITLESMRM